MKLPAILLGMRSSVCEPTQTPPSRLVLGGDIRMPADYFHDEFQRASFSSAMGPRYADRLENDIRQFTELAIRNQPTRATVNIPIMPPWVWLKQIPGISSLKRPYEGPFRTIRQERSVVTIDKNGRETCVNVDRLKPAFILSDESVPLAIGEMEETTESDDHTPYEAMRLDKATTSSQPDENQTVERHNLSSPSGPSFSRYGRRQSFRFGQPIYHETTRSHREGE
jgi:hypothetical protein